MNGYVKLGLASLLPVLASIIFYLLEKKTAFGSWRKWLHQGIIGLVFGLIAVLGTEYGITINGATLNCRDAAPLCAGLFFGGPAGIIAGIIGGVERWFAVAWGAGRFTRIACTVSTIIAGFYAAALRHSLFDEKKPSWLLSLAIGVVMEVFHLTMVFVTNLSDASRAITVVESCTPMILYCGGSVMLTAIAIVLLRRESLAIRHITIHITETIQRWLLLCVAAAFIITSGFVFFLQDGMTDRQTEQLLSQSIEDVRADILNASDENLLARTRLITGSLDTASLSELAEFYDVAEINIVDDRGIITDSTNPDFLGYDMASGEQSREFLCLLQYDTEYAQPYGPIAINSRISRKYAAVRTDTGFVQVGYDAVTFQRDLLTQVARVTRNRHVGNGGYMMVATEKGRIVSALEGKPVGSESPVWLSELRQHGQGTVQKATIYNQAVRCMYMNSEGYSIIAVLPETEATQSRDIAIYVNTFLEVLVFAVLFSQVYLLIKKVVLNNLRSINNSLAQITEGNLDVVVNVRSNAEFSSLSDDINSTVDTLKRYISEASARIDAELEFAKNIQASALPSTFPAFPTRKDFDIYASMDPAKEIGGDFYDFYFTNIDKLNFLVADVSGKGIPAAMFMMRAKTELKRLAETQLPVDQVFCQGNDHLCEGNDADMFVTSWMGQIDLKTGLVSFANAGHNPPLVRHENGSFEYLRSRAGLVLGGMDGVPYRRQEVTLQPGDIVFLYTDGVTEATDASNTLYGEERLQNILNTCSFTDMESLCRSVKADVDAFVGEAPQFDDITMLALKFNGKPAIPELHFDAVSLDDIPVITEFVEQELEKMDCPPKAVIQLSIAIDEMYSNIVKFSYGGKSGPASVRLEPSDDPHGVTLVFTDEGIPYNPLKKEDPDVTLSAEDRQIGGLGIFMVKKTMDDMSYEYRNEQNILRLFKKF